MQGPVRARQSLVSVALALAATVGCAGMAAEARANRTRELRGEGVTDQRCPDGMGNIIPKLPAGWSMWGTKDFNGMSGAREFVYLRPDGKQSTWCEYTREVWERQRAALGRGQEPSHEIYDDARRELIARERDALAKKVDERRRDEDDDRGVQLAARAAYDRSIEEAAVERAADERSLQHAQAEERERHEVASGRLAGILLAKAHLYEMASAQLCVQRHILASARADLARERRITSESGTINLRVAHGAGESAVDAADQAEVIGALVRRRYGRAPAACKAGISAAADCFLGSDDCPDSDVFSSAWEPTLTLLDGDSIEDVEAEARGDLLAGTARAEERAKAAAALMLRR